MASLIEQLVQTHGSEVAGQLSGKLGISEDRAAGLLPALAPMILGGLQRQAQQNGGADRVDHILDRHADESVLDNIGGFLSQKADEPVEQVDPGLGGLLGGAGGQASQMIGSQLGLSQDKANQIIPMLAPIVLGFLNRQRHQAGGGSQGQNLVMSFLDQDGDGSILDDVAGMLGGGSGIADLLGGGGSPGQSQSGGGGLLGKVLGGLLGGKR